MKKNPKREAEEDEMAILLHEAGIKAGALYKIIDDPSITLDRVRLVIQQAGRCVEDEQERTGYIVNALLKGWEING